MTLLAAHEDAPAARLRLALDAVLVVKPNARVNSKEARRRADNLQARLQKRMERLDLEKHISALPPVVLGGLIVVPTELLAEMTGTAMPAAPRCASSMTLKGPTPVEPTWTSRTSRRS